LENRGHDVWFDKAVIRAGDDWRHSITDGILKSNPVLLLPLKIFQPRSRHLP